MHARKPGAAAGEKVMLKLRMRTKFLLSMLLISAGLTCTSLLLVRHSVQKQMTKGNLRRPAKFGQHFPELPAGTRTYAYPLRRAAGGPAQPAGIDDHGA